MGRKTRPPSAEQRFALRNPALSKRSKKSVPSRMAMRHGGVFLFLELRTKFRVREGTFGGECVPCFLEFGFIKVRLAELYRFILTI